VRRALPWLNTPAEFDEAGQLNAYFRWKGDEDSARRFAMQLWIEHPPVTSPVTMPDRATVDVTPRRLQQFKVKPGSTYSWQLTATVRRSPPA